MMPAIKMLDDGRIVHGAGCPKCGNQIVSVVFVSRPFASSSLVVNQDTHRTRHVEGEQLQVTCQTCSFWWQEDTRDTHQEVINGQEKAEVEKADRS